MKTFEDFLMDKFTFHSNNSKEIKSLLQDTNPKE